MVFRSSHPADIPTLLGADGKTFRPGLLDFAQAAVRGSIRPQDLAREAQAQIQKLQRAGIDVTHIDTHKHTHIFPSVAGPVLHIAERCGIQPVRMPFEPRWSTEKARLPLRRKLQLRVLERFRPSFQQMTRERRMHGFVPDGTLGIAATGTLDANTLRTTLAALPDEGVFEFCCHPGYMDEALLEENTRLQESREVEREAFLRVIPEMLRNAGAPRLIHYGNLGIPGLQRASGQFAPYNGHEKVL